MRYQVVEELESRKAKSIKANRARETNNEIYAMKKQKEI